LKSLDGMEEQLDDAVEWIWEHRDRTYNYSNRQDNALEIALRHGLRPALEQGYHLLYLIKPEFRRNASSLIQALRDSIDLHYPNPQVRYDDLVTLRLLELYRSEDLVFDLIRQKFVAEKNEPSGTGQLLKP